MITSSSLTVLISHSQTQSHGLTGSQSHGLTHGLSISDSISRCHRHHHSHGVTAAIHGCSLSLSLCSKLQVLFLKKAQSVSQVHNETDEFRSYPPREDFMSLSMKMTCVLSREECQLWVVMTWLIWNARNRLIHTGEQTNS
uniref:Uncharacterized protein n=1 Tax=Fagus sylvatica TaxID=28930 RepID=A0A2N9G1Q4_FAGSY